MEAKTVDYKFELPKVFEKYYNENMRGQNFNEEEAKELIQIVSGMLGALIYMAQPSLEKRKELNAFIYQMLDQQLEQREINKLKKEAEKAVGAFKSIIDSGE